MNRANGPSWYSAGRSCPPHGALRAERTPPKFHSATGSVTGSGRLSVSFDERGLGNGNIDYMLTADATAVFAIGVPSAGGFTCPKGQRLVLAIPDTSRTFFAV